MMKTTVLLTLTLAFPAASHAAPARHAAAKKPVHHAVSHYTIKAVQAAPQSAPGQPAGDRPFPNVPPDHWAAAAVETLHKRGIVVGYPAGAEGATK